ncbi:MAG TPA: hypothetical protein VH142_13645 [Polyangiaceae bacterium]|jgi:hypothetical protein|nr:hypothetical protein [Polyangiaceae bacterium]
MSLNFQKLSSFRALATVAVAFGLLRAEAAFAADPTTSAAAPVAPLSPSASPPSPTPNAAPSAPSTPGASDADVTVEAETAPAPSPTPAPSAPPATTPAPTPAPAPAAAAPATTTQANTSANAAPQAAANTNSTTDTNGTDSILDDAGYPLTPGVSSLSSMSHFVLSGYLQSQYEFHQDSANQLDPSGTALNRDRFLLRRGRFLVTSDWQWAQIRFELDGNTVNGPVMRVQKAEASLVYGRSKDKDQPPIAMLTMGEFDLPFGFEVPYVPKVRWFMERTQASRALFPGEPDLGVRFAGGFGFARYSVAVTNGEPLDEKSGFQLQDPNSNKDVTARFGAEAKPARDFVLAGGVSYNRGKGLSKGTLPSKSFLTWSDTSGDGRVQLTELTGNTGVSAQPSKTFSRWAIGADVQALLKTGLGWSMLYAEIVGAANLDRGLYVADPVATGADVRELGYYIAFTQELTRYGVVGFRYDFYDPNADFLESRRAALSPASQRVMTYSPLVGLVIPGRARLLFQYDFINDRMGRNAQGVPADFKNDEWTLRLQVNL